MTRFKNGDCDLECKDCEFENRPIECICDILKDAEKAKQEIMIKLQPKPFKGFAGGVVGETAEGEIQE
jgi:hypothetical protein